MKIRTDFVTNSSSSSFGVAAVESLATVVATGTAVAVIQAAQQAAAEALGLAATQATQEAAEKIASSLVMDTSGYVTDQVLSEFGPEASRLEAESRDILNEISNYKQQWEVAQQGTDPDDPGFKQLKQQYDEYFDYLNSKLADVNARKYDLAVAAAEKQSQMEAKAEWVRNRQQDLVATLEQRSLLEATIRGYGGAGFDMSEARAQLQQLSAREAELRGQLRENGADIDYTPRDRGNIGPGKEFLEIKKQKEAEIRQLEMAKQLAEQTAEKRRELEARIESAMNELRQAEASAARWDIATKAVEGIQAGADVGVDLLSNVTGPAGKTIRTIYIGAKGVAGGVGQSMADGGNVASNVFKGAVKGAADIVKDKLEGKAKAGFTIVSEAGQGALEAWTKGESIAGGAFKGGIKGTLEVGTGKLLDKFSPPGDPLSVNWGKQGVGTVVSDLGKRNPLTVGVIKSVTKSTLKGAGSDQVKNFVKGDDVVFSGWKHNLLG